MSNVKKMKALKLATHDKAFVAACERANAALENVPGCRRVEPTRRQYRKYLRGYGSAFQFGQLS